MKALTRFVVLLLLLTLCLSACGEANPTTQPATTPAANHYTVKVQDADGNPIAGAMVSMCQAGEGGICYMPGTTDENGIVSFPEEVIPVQNNMKVRVLNAVGYALPLDENGEISYTLIPDGTTEVTLVLKKA